MNQPTTKDGSHLVLRLGIIAAITGIFMFGSLVGMAGMFFGLYYFFTHQGDKKRILIGMALSALGMFLAGLGTYLLLS